MEADKEDLEAEEDEQERRYVHVPLFVRCAPPLDATTSQGRH